MGHPSTHGEGSHAHAPRAAPPQSRKQSLSCRHSHAHAAPSSHSLTRVYARAQRRNDRFPAKSTDSKLAFVKRPCSSYGREKKSHQVSSHRLAVSAFARACSSSTRAADGFELPRSHLGARPFFDDEVEEDAAGRRQTARQAAEARGPAGGCQHVGAQWSEPAHEPLQESHQLPRTGEARAQQQQEAPKSR